MRHRELKAANVTDDNNTVTNSGHNRTLLKYTSKSNYTTVYSWVAQVEPVSQSGRTGRGGAEYRSRATNRAMTARDRPST